MAQKLKFARRTVAVGNFDAPVLRGVMRTPGAASKVCPPEAVSRTPGAAMAPNSRRATNTSPGSYCTSAPARVSTAPVQIVAPEPAAAPNCNRKYAAKTGRHLVILTRSVKSPASMDSVDCANRATGVAPARTSRLARATAKAGSNFPRVLPHAARPPAHRAVLAPCAARARPFKPVQRTAVGGRTVVIAKAPAEMEHAKARWSAFRAKPAAPCRTEKRAARTAVPGWSASRV
jgi:hypothetical protein